MSSLNVRLGKKDDQRLKRLRKAGVNVSQLVREAIAERADNLNEKPAKIDVASLMKSLDDTYPLGSEGIGHGIDTANRHELSAYIRQRLKAKQDRIGNDSARHKRSGGSRRSA